MKHWNYSDTASVCENCGFQTFSQPIYKRHLKHCTESSAGNQNLPGSSLNGSMKELSTCSKEEPDIPNSSKSHGSVNKTLLYCKQCSFSCLFSSQLINHTKRVHVSETKNQQESAVCRSESSYTRSSTNGATDHNMEMEEINVKKEFVLKKLKLEIPGGDGLNIFNEINKEHSTNFETTKLSLVSPVFKEAPTSAIDGDENKSRKCPVCGFVTKTKDQFLSHRAGHETSGVMYSCNECEYKTSVRKNFERHEWCHVVDSPFKCQYCSFSSNGENAIKRHMSAYHTVQKQQKESKIKNNINPPGKSSTIPSSTKSMKVSLDLSKKGVNVEVSKKKQPTASASAANSSIVAATTSATATVSSTTTTCATASVPLKQLVVKLETNTTVKDFVCPHCGLCYAGNLLLEDHIRTSHAKLPVQNKPVVRRTLIQPTHDQLKRLEVSNLKIKDEFLQESKIKNQLSKIKIKIEPSVESDIDREGKSGVKKVYKCGYCSFSTNEFGKLREHLENESFHPVSAIGDSKTLTNADSKKETVLQKLLTNDNPNKVYPNVPLVAVSNALLKVGDSPAHKVSAGSEKKTLVKVEMNHEIPMTNATVSLSRISLDNGSAIIEGKTHDVSPSKVSIYESLSSSGSDKLQTKKTYINCLFCTYKTLSVKVIRKHLIREHSSIIITKKILKEVVHKSVILSLRYGDSNLRHSDQQSGVKLENNAAVINNGVSSSIDSSEVLLHMDVQCEAESNPQASGGKKLKSIASKQTNAACKFRPFQCSECGKRSNWKHIIKKHIDNKHSHAKINVLSPQEAEESYSKFLKSYQQKKIAKKLTTKKFKFHNYGIDLVHHSLDVVEGVVNVINEASAGGMDGSEDGASSNSKILDSEGQERLGMSDLLRLRRFKCSVCIYRSNFRCDMSRHLKKRHPDVPNCHFTVLPVQEATETIPHYNYSWAEAEALLLGTTVKEENLDAKTSGDHAKIDPVVERRAAAIISRFPFGTEEMKRCHICPFASNKTELLRLHMAYHQPQKRNCYSCPHCPYFVNTARLLRHHLTLHENDQFIKSVAAERTATQLFNAYNSEFNYVKRNPKYICEDCPYTNNNRNEFWRHRRCHFERGDVQSDLKCHHCPYWAEDKKDWQLHTALHGGHCTSFTKRADLAIREFCRCDLADLKNFPDLACFKQLRCPCCTIRSSSVNYMRHHMLFHMAFTDAAHYRVFDQDLDDADETLGNLCTRLLNMNYFLVEECRRETPTMQNSAEDDDNQMPILEKVTEIPEDSGCPNLSISVQLVPPQVSGKVIESSTDLPYLGISEETTAEVLCDIQESDDVVVLAAPEVVIEIRNETNPLEMESAQNDIGDHQEVSSVHSVYDELTNARNAVECPHAQTLFLLGLNLVPRKN